METFTSSFWAPSATVRFGGLEFIATADRSLTRIEASAPSALLAANVAIEATIPRHAPANGEFVGMTGFATESFFDLLDQEAGEDSDHDSSDGDHYPARTCNMVHITTVEARSDNGPAPPEPNVPGTPVEGRAHTAPPAADDPQARLQVQKLELKEARRNIAEEAAAVEWELELQRQRARSQARQRARCVNQQIANDGTAPQHFPRPGQNVAAAAALLQTLPIQPTPEAQRAQKEMAALLAKAAEQQAESSRRRVMPSGSHTSASHCTSCDRTGGSGHTSA